MAPIKICCTLRMIFRSRTFAIVNYVVVAFDTLEVLPAFTNQYTCTVVNKHTR